MSAPGAVPLLQAERAGLDRAWIAAHIPHQGSMCLLDRVDTWDAQRLQGTATSHRDPANPLRAGGRLGALAGIEYAAQAVAIHGALLAGDAAAPAPGYLGSARSVDCRVARLDDVDDALVIDVERLSADARTLLYAFTLSAGGRVLIDGRLAVVLAAAPPPSPPLTPHT